MFNQAIIRYLNEDAIVSYSIISYINAIVIMSMVGVAQGCQPLVSYYYGKGEKEKCRRLLKYELCTVAAASVLAVGVCCFLADKIVGIFISANLIELRKYSAQVFRVFILSFLLAGYNVAAAGYFTAIEKPGTAVVISLGRGLVMLIISMVILTALFGGKGIWWAAALSEALCLVVSVLLLKREGTG